MNKEKQLPEKPLQGKDLTQEQFSDVYMAGTSDGVHQLGNGKKLIKRESYEKK